MPRGPDPRRAILGPSCIGAQNATSEVDLRHGVDVSAGSTLAPKHAAQSKAAERR